MNILIGFVICAAIVGAGAALFNGGKLKDVAIGALQGGGVAAGCLVQLALAALPVLGGLFVIALLVRGCSH